MTYSYTTLWDVTEANALRFAEHVRAGLDNLTFAERQELMRLLIEDVTCQWGKAPVRTAIPVDKAGGDVSLCTPIRGQVRGKTSLRLPTDGCAYIHGD